MIVKMKYKFFKLIVPLMILLFLASCLEDNTEDTSVSYSDKQDLTNSLCALKNYYETNKDFISERLRENQQGDEEFNNLLSQTAIARWGGRRTAPYVFTEQGVAMLSSVLKSERAVKVNIAIMRAFVVLRRMIASNEDLARKLDEMEKKYDKNFAVVFDAIKRLMAPPDKDVKRIGFGDDK